MRVTFVSERMGAVDVDIDEPVAEVVSTLAEESRRSPDVPDLSESDVLRILVVGGADAVSNVSVSVLRGEADE